MEYGHAVKSPEYGKLVIRWSYKFEILHGFGEKIHALMYHLKFLFCCLGCYISRGLSPVSRPGYGKSDDLDLGTKISIFREMGSLFARKQSRLHAKLGQDIYSEFTHHIN